MERMESEGRDFVGAANHAGKREILLEAPRQNGYDDALGEEGD